MCMYDYPNPDWPLFDTLLGYVFKRRLFLRQAKTKEF
jgi:hypothetical protein